MKRISTGIVLRNFKEMQSMPTNCIGFQPVFVCGTDKKLKLIGQEVIQVCHVDSYPPDHEPLCKTSGHCVWEQITKTTGPVMVADQTKFVDQQLSFFITGEIRP